MQGRIIGAAGILAVMATGHVSVQVPTTPNNQTLDLAPQIKSSEAPRYAGRAAVAPDGTIYGTAHDGGPSGGGIVFSLAPNGSGGFVYATLHAFKRNGATGAQPRGVIWGSDGNLYGTTTYGGATNAGTVFKLSTSGVLTTLRSFNYSDGAYPCAIVIEGLDGYLYGTTHQGGTNGIGTVFRIRTDGTDFSTRHSFTSTTGAYLVQASDGNSYGDDW